MIKELISDIDGTIYEYESNKKSLSREVYKEAGLIFLGDGVV